MPATPTDKLIANATCIDSCIAGDSLKLSVLISIWAQIAGMSTNTDSLIAGAKCIVSCVPEGMMLPILISLADQINQNGGTGGGGGGASCLSRSIGAPVAPPPAACPTAINFDDQGGEWWWDTASASWIKFG